MARPLRIEYPGAWYHVMNRGRRGESIFRIAGDYDIFLGVLKETVELFHLKVAAYCLMTNHYHLLLHTPDGNISRCMRHINGVYTQRFNRKYQEDGALFRGRYKSIVVDNDNYLLEVLRYIHRNPVRAGIVKTPDDYPWSSHNGYTSRAKKWDWLYKEFLLEMFSEKRAASVQSYIAFATNQETEEIQHFYSKKNLSAVLGGEKFKKWLKSRFAGQQKDKEIPDAKILSIDGDEIRKHVAHVFKTSEDMFFRSCRGRENSARDVAIYLQRKHCRQTLAELGREYNVLNYSTVSSAYERIKVRLRCERELLEKIKKVEEIIEKAK